MMQNLMFDVKQFRIRTLKPLHCIYWNFLKSNYVNFIFKWIDKWCKQLITTWLFLVPQCSFKTKNEITGKLQTRHLFLSVFIKLFSCCSVDGQVTIKASDLQLQEVVVSASAIWTMYQGIYVSCLTTNVINKPLTLLVIWGNMAHCVYNSLIMLSILFS